MFTYFELHIIYLKVIEFKILIKNIGKLIITINVEYTSINRIYIYIICIFQQSKIKLI